MASACASVFATTKSTPFRPALIMLFTALPPPPPTPNTQMRAFSSVMSALCNVIDLGRRPSWQLQPPAAAAPVPLKRQPSEPVPEPLPDTPQGPRTRHFQREGDSPPSLRVRN